MSPELATVPPSPPGFCPIDPDFVPDTFFSSPKPGAPSHDPDREALNDLINDATHGGRKPLTDSEADTILDWAREVGVQDSRDDRGTSHWDGGDHIHVPGYGGKPHIPTKSN